MDQDKASNEEGGYSGNNEKLTVGEVSVEVPTGCADVDVAANFLASLDPAIAAAPITDTEYKKVLRKIDFIILPLIAATIILAAVDKVIISNASIYGMIEDTRLAPNEFSWVGSIFYFGYLVFEYPCALLIQRFPVAKLLAGACFGWAAMMLCIAATQNFGGLAACRFIMGMTEAMVFPVSSMNDSDVVEIERAADSCGFLVQPRVCNFLAPPLDLADLLSSSIFSGIVSYGIGQTNVSLAPWRLLFIVLGAYSILWAAIIWIWLPDSPMTCRWMSDREKYICLVRVKGNNTGIEDRTIKWYQVKECLLDPKTWLLAIFSCAQNIPNGGLVTFAAIIVSGLGYSRLNTVLLGIPTGVLATVWQLMLAFPSAKLKNSRCIIIACSNLVPMMCAILMWQLPRSNQQGLLAAYYCFYTYWAPYVLSTSLPMANTSGHTKKTTMNAIFFLAYCLGNILGPQVFRAEDAPNYTHGYIGLLCCILVAIASITMYGYLCYRDNKTRDAQQGVNGAWDAEFGSEAAFTDLTDKEKLSFRYSY